MCGCFIPILKSIATGGNTESEGLVSLDEGGFILGKVYDNKVGEGNEEIFNHMLNINIRVEYC